MARVATVLEVVIASPGDVTEYRDAVEQAILEWNSANRDLGIVLLPRRWERDVPPNLGSPAQTQINNAIIKRADILIGVFWHRMGTVTKKAGSGTEEEIFESIRQRKPCLIYTCDDPIPSAVDIDQLSRLRMFVSKLQSQGLTHKFIGEANLRADVSRHLSQIVKGESSTNHLLKQSMRRGTLMSNNLVSDPIQWKRTYEIHRGSYLMYTFRQMAVRIQPGALGQKDIRNVCVSLLNITGVSDFGIEWELYNPQFNEHDGNYRLYTYKGVAYPSRGRFLYLFADQVDGDYEVISAIIEAGAVPKPKYLVGHLVCIGVDAEKDLFYPGSTGFLLHYLQEKRANPKDLLGNLVGEFADGSIDSEVIRRMPKLYYSQIAPVETFASST